MVLIGYGGRRRSDWPVHVLANDITETWLHDQINDAEIAINDYHIFVKIEKAEEAEYRGTG